MTTKKPTPKRQAQKKPVQTSKPVVESSVNYLDPHKPCPDYPDVMQCSIRCQNCRYNRMFADKLWSTSKMTCAPHTAREAAEKGAPGQAPAEHVQNWLDKVAKHNAEKELTKKAGEEVCDE